jgi:hypothetical protein
MKSGKRKRNEGEGYKEGRKVKCDTEVERVQ